MNSNKSMLRLEVEEETQEQQGKNLKLWKQDLLDDWLLEW